VSRKLVVSFCAVLLAVSLVVPVPLQAQNAEPPKRARLGLALSGGSALALAHIGVIKWLEENRIPVEYIAGTSMGGLVSGLYASGMDSKEMQDYVSGVNWQEVFISGVPYGQKTFRRKEDLRDYPNRFELGLHKGLEVPFSLNPGQGVNLVVSRVAAPYSEMKSFDDMPTPFRAVATDLVSGNKVVYDKGDLFDAMRATMSIPAYFAPVRQGKRVMVDGGTLQNIPVEAVKDMGADTIVAVELNDTMLKPYEPTSLINVLGRTMAVMIISNEMRSLAQANLILSPDLKGLDSFDFTAAEEFIKRGYAAAEKQAQLLRSFAVSEQEWQQYLENRKAKRRSQVITPKFIQVEGAVPGSNERILARLGRFMGEPVDAAALDNTLTRVAGAGRYDSSDYRYVQRGGEDGLVVNLHRKTYGPPVLNTVLDVDGSDIYDVVFGIGGRVTFFDFGGYNSEWRTDFNLGYRNILNSEYYWRINASRFFIAPRGYLDYSRQPLYQGNQRVADYRIKRQGGGMDVGLLAGRSNEFRFGLDASHVEAFASTGATTLPRGDGAFQLIRGKWQLNAMDEPIIPHNGARITVQGSLVFDTPDGLPSHYPIAESRIVLAREFSRRHIFIMSLAGGTTAGHDTALPAFTLGGPLRLTALARDQFFGNNYYYSGFAYLRSLTNAQLSLFGRPYLTFAYELGNAFNDIRDANPYNNAVVGVTVETPFGGLLVGGAFGEQGNHKFFFRIGRLF